MLIAVNYHYVRPSFDDPHPGIRGVTTAQLESQLRILGSCGAFVSADDILAAVRGDCDLPEQAVVVTFDDGLQEHYEHAWPVLRRLGIPAIFFVNTQPITEKRVSWVHKIHLLRSSIAPADFVAMLEHQAALFGINVHVEVSSDEAGEQYPYDPPEVAALKYWLNFLLSRAERDRLVEACFQEVFSGKEAEISAGLYLTREQVAALGAYHMIGSHGHEHLPLGLLERSAIAVMVCRSLDLLEPWAGYRPFAMSYPYGNRAASLAAGEVASQLGVEFAFTIEKAGNDADNLRHPMYLARVDANDAPGGKAWSWTAESLFASLPAGTWYREAESSCQLNRG